MRVLFTSLFFGLVAILTLASHPPVEAISRVFSGDPPPKDGQQITDSRTTPTGIIPVPTAPEQAIESVPEPAEIPDPIAVPEVEIANTPVEELDLDTEEAVEPPAEAPLAEIEAPKGTSSEAEAPDETAPPVSPETPHTLSENIDTPENRRFIRSLNLHAVYFGSGASDLPESSHAGMNKAASQLANVPDGVTVIIGGHTDAHSESQDAWELGHLRAKAALDALIDAGAPADRLQLAHYPTTKKRPNASDAWRDRRVEFHLLPPR